MPFTYKTQVIQEFDRLDLQINEWASKGYEPHGIYNVERKSKLDGSSISTLLLVVRKVVRRQATARRVKSDG